MKKKLQIISINLLNFLSRLPSMGVVVGIRLYQLLLSSFLGGHCRFEPSCSHYSIQAFQTHSFISATRLTIKRIFRCHPFGSYGYDPVPKNPNQNKEIV